jgi:acyl transferase domain-containing protein/NAD(P)-dependent dehydrogenase (short-subunit alcohol dehydrogenase family)
MALVELAEAEAAKAIAGLHAELAIAAVNGPETVLLSGESAALEALVKSLGARGVFARFVDVDYASHSAQMDPLAEELSRGLAALAPRAAGVAFCSTVSGDLMPGETLDARYWFKNLRQPVRFADAVAKLAALGHDLFVEVSPHPVLLPSLDRALRIMGDGEAVASLRRDEDEVCSFSDAVARAYVCGASIDWANRYASSRRVERLPMQAWQRERFQVERRTEARRVAHPIVDREFRWSKEAGTRAWEGTLDVARARSFADHRVRGGAVVAGAAYVEAAACAAVAVWGPGSHVVSDVAFQELLALPNEGAVIVQLVLSPPSDQSSAETRSFELRSLTSESPEHWTRHAVGSITRATSGATATVDLDAVRARCKRRIAAAVFYETTRTRGLDYHASYRGLDHVLVGLDEALGHVKVAVELDGELGVHAFHPAILDACMQVMGSLLEEGSEDTYLPISVASARIYKRAGGSVWAHASSRRDTRSRDDRDVMGDVAIVDDDGQLLAQVEGLRLRRVGRASDRLDHALFEVGWIEGAAAAAPPAPIGRWLLFSDGDVLGTKIAAHIEQAGGTVVHVSRGDSFRAHDPSRFTVNPACPADAKRLLGEAFPGATPCAGIVHLWATSAIPASSSDAIASAQVAGCIHVLHVVQAIAAAPWRDGPRLRIVTRGAHAVLPGDAVHVAHASLSGLAKVIAHEHPDLGCLLVDLPATPAETDADDVARELCGDGAEDRVALRAGRRFVARLLRTRFDGAPQDPPRPAGDHPFRLEIATPGVFDSLALRGLSRRAPGAGEVEIEVQRAGLNFLDVLIALGALPDDAAGATAARARLGGECAGTIVRVGAGAPFEVGDEVVAVAPDAFATHVTANAELVVRMPNGLSFQAAAGVPIAFLTAWIALRHVAKIEKGERVLIHAAAGGVGLAAVQIARLDGSEVFATAGSDEKRTHLRAMGVRQVSSSRTLDFVREVMDATGGDGVDVVLNSLSGEFITKSLGLLRSHGRFVEIGKRDYYDDKRIGLRPFLRNLSFSLVDLRGMLETRPAFIGRTLREITAQITKGVLTPLPTEGFPAAAAADAFRHMAQAKHVGKIVLAMPDREAPITSVRDVAVRPDATYLITGGLGGLGLTIAEHLVELGARRLVLMGRTDRSKTAARELERVANAGAEVVIALGDVAVHADVRRVLDGIVRSGSALGGIVHAAGIVEDGMLLRQTRESFERVMAPKIRGAWNLHAATLDVRLDFFVLFSSVAGVLGAPGQGNYAAASAFLDALAHHRRALGLPATSIDWGAWSDTGLAAADDNRARRAASQGMASLSPKDGARAFARLLGAGFTQICVVPFDLRQWFQFHPRVASAPLFASLAHEATAERSVPATRFKQELLSAPADRRRVLLERHVAEELAAVLRTTAARVAPTTPFGALGLDSLASLELRNRLERSLGEKLSATVILSHPTTAQLALYLARSMPALASAPGALPALDDLPVDVGDRTKPAPRGAALLQRIGDADEALPPSVDALSDVEAEAALLDVLAALDGDP